MADTRKRSTTNRANTGNSNVRKNTKTNTKRKKQNNKNKQQAENDFFKKDFIVLLAFGCAILLFLSLFNQLSTFGKFIKEIMLGGFGIVGYAIPFLSFFGICFYLVNKDNPKALVKILILFGILILFCGMYEIICMGSYDSSLSFGEYCRQFIAEKKGGLLGGLLTMLLVPILGSVGSMVILFIPFLIGLVYITEKSIVDFVSKRSRTAYEYVKEDVSHKKEALEAKREEKKAYRYILKETSGNKKGEPAVSGSKNNTADQFVGEIHLPADFDSESGDEIVSRPPGAEELPFIMAEKEKRTLSELEVLEGIRNTSHMTELKEEEAVFTPSEPETSDIKQIVTAAGKVIEVEADPLETYAPGYEKLHNLERKKQEEEAALTTVPVRASLKTDGRANTETMMVPPKPKVVKEYQLPPIELLSRAKKKAGSGNIDRELKETAIKLQQTLQNFGVSVTVTDISCGPAVTRYELHPEQGVKVSKIVSLADDIKLNLAATDIRIEAPIPGKAAVGIEVPNKENSVVPFRELLESEEYKKHPSKICFGAGKDIAGRTVIADIARMPHLLIAGATGSGKSVCINTLIMSILYKATPDQVKLIMIDPKVVELSVYNGIPHLLIPVVTDPKKASGALNWAVAEMSDRYKKFAEYNVRDLKGYNKKIEQTADIDDPEKPEKLPQIVIIVDELADLMMVAPGEVEDAICRLAQLARAAGIHLVIATQRPSVNVITGLIKANVPSRIAFSVSSGVDSRTIIDMNGAEKLLGKGDMLFYPSGYAKPIRVQGAFVSDSDVTKVVEFLVKQGGSDHYEAEIESKINSAVTLEGGADHGAGDKDAYFIQAARFIVEKDKASIGMLQRAFKIGFNRAARIMDQLAKEGIVGEEEGTKPRKILMSMEQLEDYIEQRA